MSKEITDFLVSNIDPKVKGKEDIICIGSYLHGTTFTELGEVLNKYYSQYEVRANDVIEQNRVLSLKLAKIKDISKSIVKNSNNIRGYKDAESMGVYEAELLILSELIHF